MKRFLTTCSLVFLISACAPAAPVPSQAQTGGAVQPSETRSANQVLRVAQGSIPTSLSPEQGETHRPVFWLMYDMLVYLDGTFSPVPSVAEKWELVNPTTYRFTLRKDLTFSNGDKLTAADVEYTTRLMLDTKAPRSPRPNSF